MSDQKSFLPPAADIEQQVLMHIVQVCANHHASELKKLTVEVQRGDQYEQVTCDVHMIRNDQVKGYLPSRVWFDDNDMIWMSFYANATLPIEARPLGDQGFSVFSIEVPRGATVRYDMYTQVFIDQIKVPGKDVRYVFVCAEKELAKLIAHDKE